MKLADLRKLAIRREFRIKFILRNGMECVVDQRGVARVPALNTVPDFNLEEELAAASAFTLEPAGGKDPAVPRPVRREELAAMTNASPSAEAHEHEEE
jgi:hypothetical protein